MIEILVSGLSIVIAIAVGLVLYFNNVDIDKNLKSITNQINDVNTSSASIENTQNKVLKSMSVDLSDTIKNIKTMKDTYVTKTTLADYAKNDKLAEYAKTIDLNHYAKVESLSKNVTSDQGIFKKLNVGSTITNTSASDPGPLIEKNYGVGNSFGLGQYTNGTLRVYGAGKNAASTVNLSIMKNDGTFNDAVTVNATGNVVLNGDTLAKKKLSASAYGYSNSVQGKNWASYINPNNGFMVFDPNFNGTMTNMGVVSLGADGTVNSAGMANFKGDVKTSGILSGSNLCLNNSVPSQCLNQDDVSYIKGQKANKLGDYSQVYIKNKDGRSSHLAYSDSVNYLRGNVVIDQDSLTIGATPVAGTKGLNIRNPDGRFTHFPFSDGKSYIRSDTIINGSTTVANGDNSVTTYGPNTSWNSTLAVGAGPTRGGPAQVLSTDGNLHLDNKVGGKNIYLNYYNPGNVLIGNPTGTTSKLCVGTACVNEQNMKNITNNIVANGDNSVTTYGPNTSWNSTLTVGAGPTRGGPAQVLSTDGNLHLDNKVGGKNIYLNYHNPGNVLIGNPAGTTSKLCVGTACVNEQNIKNIANNTLANGDNSVTTYGPNTSWNSTLTVGAGPTRGGPAQVLSTDGNLHLDNKVGGKNIYLNYYNPGNVLIGNPAGTTNKLCLGSVCFNEAEMRKLKTLAV